MWIPAPSETVGYDESGKFINVIETKMFREWAEDFLEKLFADSDIVNMLCFGGKALKTGVGQEIDTLLMELKEAGVDKIIEEANRQLEKWKKEKGK